MTPVAESADLTGPCGMPCTKLQIHNLRVQCAKTSKAVLQTHSKQNDRQQTWYFVEILKGTVTIEILRLIMIWEYGKHHYCWTACP